MLFLLFFVFIFASCSSNLQYNETAEHITINVLNSDTTILKGTVHFSAEIKPNPSYAKSYFWTVDSGKPYYFLTTPIPFAEIGVYDVRFYAVDLLGDTLSTGVSVSVSTNPVCDNLSLDIIQGSPIFKWECNADKLTYKFSLKDKDNKEISLQNPVLTDNSLQLGYNPLPSGYWEFHLTATNNHGFSCTLHLRSDDV